MLVAHERAWANHSVFTQTHMPPRSEVHQRWYEVLCHTPRLPDGRLPPECNAIWDMLWREHVEERAPAQRDIEDLGLLCRWGWQLAMECADYGEAARRSAVWLAHPEASPRDWPSWDTFHSRQGMALLYCGRVADAITSFRAALERTEGGHKAAAFHVACAHIVGFVLDQPEAYVPPRELESLMREAAARVAPTLSKASLGLPMRQLYEATRRHLID